MVGSESDSSGSVAHSNDFAGLIFSMAERQAGKIGGGDPDGWRRIGGPRWRSFGQLSFVDIEGLCPR